MAGAFPVGPRHHLDSEWSLYQFHLLHLLAYLSEATVAAGGIKGPSVDFWMEGAVKELFKITISPEDIKMGTYKI